MAHRPRLHLAIRLGWSILLGAPLLALAFSVATTVVRGAPYQVINLRPLSSVSRIVADYGGLPKQDWDPVGDDVSLYLVDRMSLTHFRVRNNRHAFLDDATYTIEADLAVEFVDGTVWDLRWSAWHYGRKLGPFILHDGDGPPGRFEVVRDN